MTSSQTTQLAGPKHQAEGDTIDAVLLVDLDRGDWSALDELQKILAETKEDTINGNDIPVDPDSVFLDAELPTEKTFIFTDSTFFQRNGPHTALPDPTEVREKSTRRDDSPWRPIPPVMFPALGLAVKWGSRISIAEGQCLWAIRRAFRERVKVPEVYGWVTDGNDVFIYMELVEGVSLHDHWDLLTDQDKTNISQQLRTMILELRKLKHDPTVISAIDGGPIREYMFSNISPDRRGPFTSVAAFHDFFSAATRGGQYNPDDPHPLRSLLLDNCHITFTHGDLHRQNIILSPDGSQINAIIDWEQAGWMPNYWELCKALYSAPSDSWRNVYLPIVFGAIDRESRALLAFEWFSRTLV
ncbi:unnamed protein product [Somion occarium]|uniref:Aminoglycoside phosphotransferase domain-containing protein n=1 Tax=Somion occarium TaxID=3059160 RepID=A0ABP1CWI0_9APHY